MEYNGRIQLCIAIPTTMYSTTLYAITKVPTVIPSFFAKITLSSINIEVEKLNKQVTKQEKTNQSLSMKINELASLENIQAVANNEGLAYNNNNIVIINNQ